MVVLRPGGHPLLQHLHRAACLRLQASHPVSACGRSVRHRPADSGRFLHPGLVVCPQAAETEEARLLLPALLLPVFQKERECGGSGWRGLSVFRGKLCVRELDEESEVWQSKWKTVWRPGRRTSRRGTRDSSLWRDGYRETIQHAGVQGKSISMFSKGSVYRAWQSWYLDF